MFKQKVDMADVDNGTEENHGQENATVSITDQETVQQKGTLSVCKWLKGCIRQNDPDHQLLFLHPWLDNPDWVPDAKYVARMKVQDRQSGETEDMTEEERKYARRVIVSNLPAGTTKEEIITFFNQQSMKSPVMDFEFNEDGTSGNLVHRVARLAAKTMIFDGIVFNGHSLTLSRPEQYSIPDELADAEQLFGSWLVVPKQLLLHKREVPHGLTIEEEWQRTIYVTGFRHKANEGDSTEAEVKKFFNSKFLGQPVYKVQMLEKEVTYAYVTFLTVEEANRALNATNQAGANTGNRPPYFLNRKKLTVRQPNLEEDGKLAADIENKARGPKAPPTEEEITEQTQKAIESWICTKPLIGMQHIYRELKEMQRQRSFEPENKPNASPKPLAKHWLFTCVLCKKSSDINNMPVHVASHYHRMNYLKLQHAEVYTNLRKDIANVPKQEQSVLVEQACQRIQDEEGHGVINIGPPPTPAATPATVTAPSPAKNNGPVTTVFTEPDQQMTKLVEECKEPLIGASYVHQLRTTSTKKRGAIFNCSLCVNAAKSDGTITHTLGTITHILGRNHRLNFIGKHYPDHRIELKKIKNRGEENKLLASIAATIEEREGRPTHIALQTEEEEQAALNHAQETNGSSILGKRARDDSSSEIGTATNPAKRTAGSKPVHSGETLVEGIRNAIALTETHALCTRAEANEALTLCSLLSDALVKYRIRNPAEASPLLLEGMRRMVHLLDSHAITSDEEASIGFQLGNQLTSSLTAFHQHAQKPEPQEQQQAGPANANKRKRQKKRRNAKQNAAQGGSGGYADDGQENGGSYMF